MTQTKPDPNYSYVLFDRLTFLGSLDACIEETEIALLRQRVAAWRDAVAGAEVTVSSLAWKDPDGLEENLDTVELRRDVLLDDLDQVLEAHTLSRAKYYLSRLRKVTCEARTSPINDVNLNRWKEYEEILTDSLWLVDRRDTSGAHGAWYWGNFIPQIPRQMMLRYTKAGDWVLDPFLGSGTTLIECRRLGRNGIGVELNPEVAARARGVVSEQPNTYEVITDIAVGDSASVDYGSLLATHGVDQVQFLILHPPYHDIIQFGDGGADLSNAPTVDDFINRFSDVVERAREVLEPRRYLAVVIGDKYQGGEWIPLGFRAMQAVMSQGCTLKSIVVKNLEKTRAKRDQQPLWRYRALVGGFYVFKHEYIFVFQTP